MQSFQRKSNIFTKFIDCLFNHKFTILLMLFLLYIAFKPNDFTFSGSILLNIAILICILSLIARIKIKALHVITIILFTFLIFISAFFSFTYSDWIWTEAVLSILRTNYHEAGEMSKAFIIPGIISLAVSTILVVFSQKEFRKYKKFPLILPLIIVLIYSLFFLPYRVNKFAMRIDFVPITDSYIITAKYTNPLAPIGYGSGISIYAALRELSHIKRMIKDSANKKDPEGLSLSPDGDNNQIQRIIFVMGESSNKHHYSLYGYNINTTPFLDSLNQTENRSLSYYNAITPAPGTVASIHRTMAFSSISNTSAAYTTKSVVDIANDCGYETYWISNQNPVGDDDNSIGAIALSAKNQNYLMNQLALNKNKSFKQPDINLIPLVKKVYNNKKKQFITIHLMGSHIYYSARIDSIDSKAISPEKPISYSSLTIEDYNRSIHQTDRVLRELYHIIENDSNSILIYIPDHGEIAGLGHCYMQQFRDQFEIPFIIYNHTDFSMDSIISKYKNAENEEFNTINISYILAELFGYKVSDERVEQAKKEVPFVYMPNGNIERYNDIKYK